MEPPSKSANSNGIAKRGLAMSGKATATPSFSRQRQSAVLQRDAKA